MKAQLSYAWIKDTDFTATNPVVAIVQNTVQEGKEKILQFKIGTEYRQMSIFGANWNLLIQKFGDETDNWNGKTIRILRFTDAATGKNKKVLEV